MDTTFDVDIAVVIVNGPNVFVKIEVSLDTEESEVKNKNLCVLASSPSLLLWARKK